MVLYASPDLRAFELLLTGCSEFRPTVALPSPEAAMDWPRPPIWPDDLDDIRELLSDADWRRLLRRHWGPWPVETTPPGAGSGGVRISWVGTMRLQLAVRPNPVCATACPGQLFGGHSGGLSAVGLELVLGVPGWEPWRPLCSFSRLARHLLCARHGRGSSSM